MKKRSQHSKLQSFLKVTALLMLAVLALTACEREESKRDNRSDVRLLNPSNGVAVKVDENLRIDYDSFVKQNLVEIRLNGILCQKEDDPVSVGSDCVLRHTANYGMASASLMSLSNLLVSGENTVRVDNKQTRQQRTLTFQFDIEPPKLIVEEIVLREKNANNLHSEQLETNDIVDIIARVEDASAIRWNERRFFVRTAEGLEQVCNNTNKDPYCAPENPRSFCNLNCIPDSQFDYQRDNTIKITGVPWPDASLPAPHFSYELKDFNGQATREEFSANGSLLENSFALQLNDRGLGQILPISDFAIDFVNGVLLQDWAIPPGTIEKVLQDDLEINLYTLHQHLCADGSHDAIDAGLPNGLLNPNQICSFGTVDIDKLPITIKNQMAINGDKFFAALVTAYLNNLHMQYLKVVNGELEQDVPRLVTAVMAATYANGSEGLQDLIKHKVGNSGNMMSPLCEFLWGSDNCYLEVTRLHLYKPQLLLEGVNSNQFNVRARVHFNSTSLEFRLYPANTDRREGKYFQSRLDINDYSLYSDFALLKEGDRYSDFTMSSLASKLKLKDGESLSEDDKMCGVNLICLERNPVQLHMHSSIWGNKQAFLRNSSCVGLGCGDKAGQLEIGWNSVTYLPKFVLWITGTSGIKAQILSIQDQLEAQAESALSSVSVLKISKDAVNGFWDLFAINKIGSKKANPFPFVDSIRNGFLGFSSKSDVNLDAVDDKVVNGEVIKATKVPSLGALYTGKNNYSYAKTGFPSRFAGTGYVDLAYAFSADSINQFLNMQYQQEDWKDLTLTITDIPSEIGTFPNVSNLCLKITANTSPRVHFYGYYHKLTSFEWEFSGSTLVDTEKLDRPGSVKLIMNDLEVRAYDCNTQQPIITDEFGDERSISVDASVRLSLYRANSKPVVKGYEEYDTANFAKLYDDLPVVVRAKHIEDIEITNYMAKAVRYELDKALVNFNSNDVISYGFSDMPLLSSIFGLGPSPKEPTKWFKYGLKYQAFGIEPSGSYFSSIIRVERSAGVRNNGADSCESSAETESYHRTFCIKADQ